MRALVHMVVTRRGARPLTMLLVCMSCLLGPGAGSALAVRGHVFSHTFGSPGTGPGELKEPVGVAVNEETGMVYVAERGNNRVQWFNSSTGKVEGEINGSGLLSDEGGVAAGHGGLKNAKGEASEEETGQFSEPADVAVDNSCKLHHLKGKACEEYDPSNGDVYVVDSGHNVVDKYTANGEYVEQINAKTLGVKSKQPRGYEVWWAAVEADGDVLVKEEPFNLTEEEGVFRLSSAVHNVVLPLSGEPAGFIEKGPPPPIILGNGLGVAGGRVFVLSVIYGGRGVSVYGSNDQLLADNLYEGSVANAGLAGEECGEDVYVDEGEEKSGLVLGRFTGSGEVLESLGVPGGGGMGVAVDCLSSTASDVFVANFATGEVDVFVPEPPGPPSVEPGSGFVSEVSSGGAKLSFVVNPRSEPGEVATSYWFEYGPCPAEGSCADAGYGQSVAGSLPASYEASTVSVTVGGLSPGTRYHYRVRAHNSQKGEEDVFSAEELTFMTESAFVVGLLDERGWELVSPSDKHGANMVPPGLGAPVAQASADGSGLVYVTTAPTETDPAGGASYEHVLSRRSVSGWESCDIGLPHEYPTSPDFSQEYVAFSEGLGLGVALATGRFSPIVSAEASEDSPYLASLPGSCAQHPAYKPLVSGCVEAGPPCAKTVEEHVDVHTGKPFGEEQDCVTLSVTTCGPVFEGANTALSAVVMRAGEKTVLVEETSEGTQVPAGALYEWSGDQLYVVSVLPSGKVDGNTQVPQLGVYSGVGPPYGNSLRGAVSEDGSRIVWTEKNGNHHLFMWDRESDRSVQVDVVQEGKGEGEVAPVFQFATDDGGKVFFTDTQALTGDSGTTNANRDRELYECEVIEGETGPKCVLNDLTPKTGSGESVGMPGQAIGYSNDAGTIYFVANGVLSTNEDSTGEKAVKGNCETRGSVSPRGSESECNLYEWHDGVISLVAVLSGEDESDWGGNFGDLEYLTGRVTGSGEWLAFMSNRSLTGYDNRDVHDPQHRDEEAYLYNSASGNLVCVSCNPTGERPDGVEDKQIANHIAVANGVFEEKTWLAASVPGWTGFGQDQSLYQPRYLDESGRMFFDGHDDLLPRATNNTENVYEYEPTGVGSCEAGGTGYIPQDKGCLGLVSSGESPEESAFVDASENGNDVFFMTASQLSKRDIDTSLDVYDARVGGIEPEEAKPVECQGDACQAPVSPPESLTPGSLTSNGPGNLLTPPAPGSNTKTTTKPKAKTETRQQKLAKALKACRKDRVAGRRRACEKRARAVYGAKTEKAKRRAG